MSFYFFSYAWLCRGEGGSLGLDRGWCILTVKKSAGNFFVGFVQDRVGWRAKGTGGGKDTEVTGGQYGGQFSSAR